MLQPAVRHHLTILRADGRLEAAPVHSASRRGRPRLAYRISGTLAGNNLAMLADHLLEDGLQERPGRQGASGLVAGLAKRLGQELQPPQPVSSASAHDWLPSWNVSTNSNTAPHWEAGAEGPHVIFGHCPYAAVIERHPELCQMDAKAIAAVMKAEVQQKAKIAQSGPGRVKLRLCAQIPLTRSGVARAALSD